MTDLLRDVQRAEIKEHDRACKDWGPTYNSDHESYAIILEELEEAQYEMKHCASALERVWSLTKDKRGSDDEKIKSLKLVYICAIQAACEIIQVAATATKAIRTIEERGKK